MEITVNELNELVLNAYEKGKRECRESEVKGEILTYRGKSCYDTSDVVIAIMKRMGEEETLIDSPKMNHVRKTVYDDKVVYELDMWVEEND